MSDSNTKPRERVALATSFSSEEVRAVCSHLHEQLMTRGPRARETAKDRALMNVLAKFQRMRAKDQS